MNKVLLIGNLTRDPELVQTPNGISYCRFSIAVSRRFANQDGERETDFFNIIAWRGLGENVHRFLKKGSKACVSGSIQLNNFEKDGVKRTNVEIAADDVEFLTPKGGGNDDDYVPAKKPARKKAGSISDLEPVEDSGDLPF